MKLNIEGNFVINLIYYFCSIILCIFFLFIGNIKFDTEFIIIFFLPFCFMFIKQKDVEKKEQIDKFDFIRYFAGLYIDFFILLGISLIALFTFLFFKWYGAIILFFNLLIDAFVAKNVFFTRFGLRKFKYAYGKSIGTVLKNSVCVFVVLANSFLTGFFSEERIESPYNLLIMCPFYLACILVVGKSLYKRKFLLTDFFKIKRYKFC